MAGIFAIRKVDEPLYVLKGQVVCRLGAVKTIAFFCGVFSVSPPRLGNAWPEVRRVWAGSKREPSADVLELYATVGGFQDYAFEENFFWSLWPWDWLQKRNEESPRDGVMFCDHSIEIVTWELRYETAKHSSVWSSHGKPSAPTLESFLDRYLQEPWQLV